jgi:hypothetical protein
METLVMVPAESLAHSLDLCKPVLEGHKDCKKLILSSLPLFLTLGCCGDVTHAPSRHDLPFATINTSGLERVRKSTHALCNNASQVRNPL